MKAFRNKKAGFSLLELLVGSGVAMVLVAAGIQVFLSLLERRADAAMAARGRGTIASLRTAFQRAVDHRVDTPFADSSWWEAEGGQTDKGWEVNRLRVRHYGQAGKPRSWELRREDEGWSWGSGEEPASGGLKGGLFLSIVPEAALGADEEFPVPARSRLLRLIWKPPPPGRERTVAILVE